MPEARLLTASCTTGWLDWIHSELWLLDDGLLVLRTSLARTLANALGPTVSSTPLRKDFGPLELETLQSARPEAWIVASSIRAVSFRFGAFANQVTIASAAGERKLLWFPHDRPEVPLREAFVRWGVPFDG